MGGGGLSLQPPAECSWEEEGCPYLCFGLGSIWSRQVFQFELGHLGFVEVISQLQPVLGQTDASRPGECGSLLLTTEHLNVLLVWDKLTRNGLGERGADFLTALLKEMHYQFPTRSLTHSECKAVCCASLQQFLEVDAMI